jgi:hypothetical protein
MPHSFLILIALVSQQLWVSFAAAQSHWIFVDQKEAKCELRDLGKRAIWSPTLLGTRAWFGQRLSCNCSYYVATQPQSFNLNSIGTDGVFTGDGSPAFYCYNVAFFDSNENLIATQGSGLPTDSSVTDNRITWIGSPMPIPVGVHRFIDSYKAVYFESDEPIGQAAIAKNAETKDGRQSQWKSDGELRNKPFHIREGTRLLPNAAGENWQAETKDGPCSLTVKIASDADRHRLSSDSKPAAELGEKLALSARCSHFLIDEYNTIEVHSRFQNPTEKKMYGQFYLAFFDKYGNLVGGTGLGFSAEPKGTYPATRAGDAVLPETVLMQMPIPLGFENTITSYKCTLYESASPIGATTATK